MIKCVLAECSINGYPIEVEAEFSLICKCVRKSFVDKFWEETGNKKFERCIELSKMSEEELKRENERMKAEDPFAAVMEGVVEKLLKDLFGGGHQ